MHRPLDDIRNAALVAAFCCALTACGPGAGATSGSVSGSISGSSAPTDAAADERTLSQARSAFATRLVRRERDGGAPPVPPADVYGLIRYPAPGGEYSAYLTPRPATPGKRPAIVWLTGGDTNTIGDVWSPQPRENDQSAAAYRDAGIVAMFPSLRGGNDNPGVREGFYGEVQDVLAAADYLATLDYVDPQRIYLGGHSTGGTLALLVAESDPRFRATFAFGPVFDVSVYGPDMLPVAFDDAEEIRLRSPGDWLSSIRSPTYLFEGDRNGNVADLVRMRSENRNAQVRAFLVPRADHFSALAPLNALIARKILADANGGEPLRIEEQDIADAMR
ncbi:MAG: peptidase [Lysobacter sp.]|nr:MAG: peptidase [Lysobacter sp.]